MAQRIQFIHRLTYAWLLLVIFGSLQPKRPVFWAGFHRQIHWLAFAGVALLLLLLANRVRDAVFRLMSSLLLGLSLESWQHLLYHQRFEWRDVGDDVLAIAVGFAIYLFLLRKGLLIFSVCVDNERPQLAEPATDSRPSN